MRLSTVSRLFLLFCFLYSSEFISAAGYNLDSLELALDNKENPKLLSSLMLASRLYNEAGLPDKALLHSGEAILLARKAGDFKSLGEAYINQGVSWKRKNGKDKALQNYLDAVNAFERCGDKYGLSAALDNIGILYREMRNPKMSLQYMESGLKVRKEIGDPALIAKSLNGLGSYYFDLNQFQDAISCFKSGLLIIQGAGHKGMKALFNNNIGSVYNGLKDYGTANEYFKNALSIYEELNDSSGITTCLANIGNNYNLLNLPKAGLEYSQRALVIARKMNDRESLPYVLQYLYEGYQKMGDYKKASEYQLQLSDLKDSIYDFKSNQNIAEMQARFETDKKERINENLRQTIQIQELAGTRQRLIIYSVSALAMLVLLLAFFILRGYRIKQKANKVLELQKLEIEHKNKELKGAYLHIEEKNKDITDSIKYALRIQNAILPPAEMVRKMLPDSFILYKPKDIISGDFFWVEQWGSRVLFAAVDCTGHGVPGALMSIVGYNLLNQALHEHGLSKPNLILNSVNKGLSSTLRQKAEESGVKDGMDIAICAWDKQTNILEFSAAYNPVWLIRDGKLQEFAGDKFPVGAFLGEQLKNFSLQTIHLKKGDLIYSFSDGFADQFGGPKGKKFKYRQFADLLLEIREKPMEEQKELLEKAFLEWKGSLEQVDDILVIGVRI